MTKKLLIASAGIFALVLLSPASSQAGTKRTATFEVTNIPMSVDAASVDCTTIADCTWISADPLQGDHNPAITYTAGEDQMVPVAAGIWGMLGCPTVDPDAVASGNVQARAGQNFIRIVFDPPLADGEFLSMEWALGGCAVTACQDYVSLGTEPPPFCNPP